jgi:hypothetical protein
VDQEQHETWGDIYIKKVKAVNGALRGIAIVHERCPILRE